MTVPRLVVVTGPPGAGKTTIAEGNFRAHRFEGLPPSEILQVHVTAEPAILRERLATRDTHRHPVHYDREAADEIAERAAAREWDALPLDGRVVRIDTSAWPDLDEVLATL